MRIVFLLSLAIVLGLPTSECGADIVSNFEIDDDGWTLTGDATSSIPNYFATGGVGLGDGFISATDQSNGDIWYWNAPIKFHGDQSSATELSFSRRMTGTGSSIARSDVILGGNAITLHLDIADSTSTWTDTLLLLRSESWRVGTSSGALATSGQIESVISDIDMLQIRGEFIVGPDTGDLDRVVFNSTAVPEPTSAMMLGSFLFAIALRRRKS